MIERTCEAFEFGDKLTVIGKKLAVGDTAPDFELLHLEPQSEQMSSVKLSDTAGKVRLLNVINSIDTPVCHVETHRWESSRSSELPDEVVVYTISMDLPYAQARWNKNENVKHQALSGHRSESFGQDYGVLVKEWRMLQRAVFVIGRDGKIAYAEYVNDQMQEPKYEPAIEAAQQAASK
jgi:thioredoxin-dependent peroxiredoxin